MRRTTRGGLVGAATALAALGVLSMPVAAQETPTETTTETTAPPETTETTAAPETTARPRNQEPDETGSSLPDDTAPEDTAPEDTAPEDTAPEDTAPGDTAPGDTAPEDTVPEPTAPPQTAPPATPPTENVPQPGPDPQPQAEPAPPVVVLPAGPVAAPQAAVRTDLPVTGPATAAVVGISAMALLAGGLVLRRARRRADEILVSHPL